MGSVDWDDSNFIIFRTTYEHGNNYLRLERIEGKKWTPSVGALLPEKLTEEYCFDDPPVVVAILEGNARSLAVVVHTIHYQAGGADDLFLGLDDLINQSCNCKH